MKKFLAISGGVGGAKLGLGLTKILSEDQLSFLVNTGDDFKHAGVNISPDIDTLMYTLSGLSNQELGWGRADESWAFLDSFETLGGESWFQLGDRDLAVHLRRTELLDSGLLTRVLPEWYSLQHPFYLVYAQQRFYPQKLRDFIDIVLMWRDENSRWFVR